MKLCCIQACDDKGYCPLYCVEGEFWIKGSLRQEIPETWLICERHFLEAIPKTRCCMEGCNNPATPHKIRKRLYHLSDSQMKIRPGCRHRQMCSEHYNKHVGKENGSHLKQPSRKHARTYDAEDDDFEAPESVATAATQPQKHPRHSGTPSRVCWHTGCYARAEVSLRLPRPFQVYACKQHAAQTESAMKPAVTQGCIASPDAAENGRRDACCCLCLNPASSKPKSLLCCNAPRCPFSYCWSCVDRICSHPGTSNAGSDIMDTTDIKKMAADGTWRCWVCLRCEKLGRPRERESWLQQLAEQVTDDVKQGNKQQQLPQTTSERKRKKVEFIMEMQPRKKHKTFKEVEKEMLQSPPSPEASVFFPRLLLN